MTVSQLMSELSKMDPNAEVKIVGADRYCRLDSVSSQDAFLFDENGESQVTIVELNAPAL